MQISEIIIKGCSSEIRSVTGQLMGDWFSSFRLRFSRCSTDGNNVRFRNDFEERGRRYTRRSYLPPVCLRSILDLRNTTRCVDQKLCEAFILGNTIYSLLPNSYELWVRNIADKCSDTNGH